MSNSTAYGTWDHVVPYRLHDTLSILNCLEGRQPNWHVRMKRCLQLTRHITAVSLKFETPEYMRENRRRYRQKDRQRRKER